MVRHNINRKCCDLPMIGKKNANPHKSKIVRTQPLKSSTYTTPKAIKLAVECTLLIAI